jgi:hypothetical protein
MHLWNVRAVRLPEKNAWYATVGVWYDAVFWCQGSGLKYEVAHRLRQGSPEFIEGLKTNGKVLIHHEAHEVVV